MRYRRDIDGLRALAIIPVVLYHVGVPGFPGGFTGVDIFFVISGYLITGLILADLEASRFSITGFYERRVRRIFPALFAMMFVAAAAGWFLLPPRDMADFGASVAATSVFASNILFAAQSGYFSAPAELKPLLHTWSLGVEEQFYLVFPLLAMVLWRKGKRQLTITVAAVAVVSFLASIQHVLSRPDASFYLGPWRAWELALGALAALGAFRAPRSRWLREASGWLGLLLIGYGVVFVSKADPFPGFNALFPCLGALLLILSGGGGAVVVNGLLGSRVLVFVGLISYSLYLWHWPLIVFAKRMLLRPLKGHEVVAVIVLSVLAALLSWRYIERPFRRGSDSISAPHRRVLLGAATAIALSCLFGAATWRTLGWPSRFDGQASVAIRGREDYRPGNCFLEEKQSYSDWGRSGPCLIDHGAASTILVWGDSFAAHYIPGLERNSKAERYNFLQYSAFSCPPVPGAKIPWAPLCGEVNANIGKVLDGHRVDAVILIARWERYWNRYVDAPALAQSIAMIRARGLPVLVVGQGPSFSFADPQEYVRRSGNMVAEPKDQQRINGQIKALVSPKEYFDPILSMCPEGVCLIRDRDQFIYWDDGHYSTFGSLEASVDLLSSIDALLASKAAIGMDDPPLGGKN